MRECRYVTNSQIEKCAEKYYRKHGKMMGFQETVHYLFSRGSYSEGIPLLPVDSLWHNLSDDEFTEIMGCMPVFERNYRISGPERLTDNDNIPAAYGKNCYHESGRYLHYSSRYIS